MYRTDLHLKTTDRILMQDLEKQDGRNLSRRLTIIYIGYWRKSYMAYTTTELRY